jgi:hypothetical protein
VNTTLRIAVLSAVVTLLGLSACVWDRGMDRGYSNQRSDNRRDDRSSDTRHDRRDRNGRPCDERDRDGDRQYDDDCGPRAH